MRLLAPAVAARITDGYLAGAEDIDLDDLVIEQGRPVDTTAVPALTAKARELHPEAPAASDAWLAPRLHCLLRLTRREAAAKGFWLHLAFVDDPEYVRWRWSGKGLAGRFMADDVNQVFSRLWWATELCRIGSHYGPVAGAFDPQDIINTILRLQAAHNRPFCAAFLRFVVNRRTDGKRLIGRQVNNLSTAINSQLFVAALDAVAPDDGHGAEAQARWRAQRVDLDALFEGRCVGPDDLIDAAFEEKVTAVRHLLHRIADGARIATQADPTAGSQRPSDRTAPFEDEDDQDSGDVRDAE